MKSQIKKEKEKRNLDDFVDGKPDTLFEYFILMVILVNTVSLGVETSSSLTQLQRHICMIIDEICLGIFIVELGIKVCICKKTKKKFFENKWNIFDLVIVLVSLISSFSYFSIFRTFRIFRSIKFVKTLKLFRAVRPMKFVDGLEQLQRILLAIVSAVPGIIWTFIMLLIFYYMYAVFGTFCFATEFPEFFGSLSKSFLTLFQVMTFDSWCSEIARPVITIYGWASLYFFSFIAISAFTILNVIVGIIVDSIEEQRTIYKQEKCKKEIASAADFTNVPVQQLLSHIDELRIQVELLTNKEIINEP